LNEARIKLVQKASSCSWDEAEMSLEAAEGDVEKAVEMVELLRRDILILKLRFAGKRRIKTQGFVFCVANGREGKLYRLEAMATHAREQLLTELTIDWEAFLESLRQYKEQLRINKQLTRELRDNLQEFLRAEVLNSLFQRLRNDEIQEALAVLEDFLQKQINEDLELDLDYELLTDFQYSENEEREEVGQKDQKGAEAELNFFLRTEPVIDPVNGRGVDSLEAGEMIMVRIIDNREVGRYLSHLLGGMEEEKRVPVAALVYGREELSSGRNLITVQFGPGIWGRFYAEGELKIKIFAEGAGESFEEEGPLRGWWDQLDAETCITAAVVLLLLGILIWNVV